MLAAPTASPSTFGRYELLAALAGEGSKKIQVARLRGESGFARRVVLKRLGTATASPEEVSAFVDEAKLGAAMRHQNVVATYDLGECDGDLFIAMEHVDGFDLRRLFEAAAQRGELLPVWWSANVVMELLAGLQHAHGLVDDRGQRRGVVHCDVALENVLVARAGEVKISDFGSAYDPSRPNAPLRPVFYLAPEAASGASPDARADVFAAGAVLWELLTLRRLFGGGSREDAMARIGTSERIAPSRINPRVPPALDAIVLAALETDRDRRIASAHDLRQHLAAVVEALHGTVRRNEVADVIASLAPAPSRPAPAQDAQAARPPVATGYSYVRPGASSDALRTEEASVELAVPVVPSLTPLWTVASADRAEAATPSTRPVAPTPPPPSVRLRSAPDPAALPSVAPALRRPVSVVETSRVWLRDLRFAEYGPLSPAGALTCLARFTESERRSAVLSGDHETWMRLDRFAQLLEAPHVSCPMAVAETHPAVALEEHLARWRPTGTIIATRMTTSGIETSVIEVVGGSLQRDVSPRSWLGVQAELLSTALFVQQGVSGAFHRLLLEQRPLRELLAPEIYERFERARDLCLMHRAARVLEWTEGTFGFVNAGTRVDSPFTRV